MTRRLAFVIAVGLCGIGALVTTNLAFASTGTPRALPPVVRRALPPTTVATTTTAPPTTTVPELSTPQDPPTDVYADVPVTEVGTIRIPKIDLVHPIYEGIWLTVIDNGPGHWPGTAAPGGYGNTVFAGHRVTHTHPFRRIGELVAGDPVIFDTAAGTFTYRVTDTKIVRPTDTWIVNQSAGYTMTLFACHPPGSASERIVVTGELEPSADARP